MPSTELKNAPARNWKALERAVAAGSTSPVGANPDVEALEDELTEARLARS